MASSAENAASGATASDQSTVRVADKPTRPLPATRVGFAKQMEMLRAGAVLVSQGTSAPTNAQIAELVGIHKNTSVYVYPFFLDVGFVTKSGDGYIPASEVLAYGKAFNWNAETAPQKLAPLLRRAWFGIALMPKLAMGQMEERRAIEILAGESGAGPAYEGQLKTILQYLGVAGLIRREGDVIRAGVAATEQVEVEQKPRTEPPPAEEPTGVRPGAPRPAITTAFTQAPEGVLRFSVDVNVDLREFSTWRPDRISAFWAGIAQVLAAKAAVEGETSK